MLVDSDVIFAESRMSFTIKPWSSKIDVTSICTFLPLWFIILFWWFHTFEPCRFWLYSPICETFNKFKCSREENIVGRRTTPTKNFYNHKKDSLKFQFFVIKNLFETDINIIDFFPISQLISIGTCVALTLSVQLHIWPSKSWLINKIRLTLLILT